MVRECSGLCESERMSFLFQKKRLPYDKGSYCKACDMYIKEPVAKEIVVTSHNHREVDIWKTNVWCLCCGSFCRGGSLSKTDKRKTKPKTLVNIERRGDKVIPVNKRVKWLKPDLPERLVLAKYYPNPVGRPKGSIDYATSKIIHWLKDISSEKWVGIAIHLNERGFTLSERWYGIDDASQDFEPYIKTHGLTRFEDLIELLNRLNDRKRSWHKKQITALILEYVGDKQFQQLMLDLGHKNITKDDILNGIKLNEKREREETSNVL